MRRFLIAGVLALGLVVLFIEVQAAEQPIASVVPINVTIGCNGEDVGEFSVNPNTARLSKSAGDTANFILTGGSDVDSVQIQPKTNHEWPFEGDPPSFGKGGRNRVSNPIRADIEPGSYGYDLIVICGSTSTPLDPRMDIDP
jgi:hypothetical protein